jgi:hypothetical protein
MSTSVRGIFTTDGSHFGGVVPAVDATTATAPAKPKLPDNTIAVLIELQGRTPADRAEWNALVSERHTLNQKTLAYIERQLTARHADLEAKHEAAKAAVREQGTVLENLKKSLAEDSHEAIRADNAHRLAGNAAHTAEVALQNLSRFASRKEIAHAEKRVIEANKNLEGTESNSAQWNEHLHKMQLVTIPGEQKKLAELIEAEAEIAAQLEGRDPILERFGIQQR